MPLYWARMVSSFVSLLDSIFSLSFCGLLYFIPIWLCLTIWTFFLFSLLFSVAYDLPISVFLDCYLWSLLSLFLSGSHLFLNHKDLIVLSNDSRHFVVPSSLPIGISHISLFSSTFIYLSLLVSSFLYLSLSTGRLWSVTLTLF